jgi:hypothetical protein
MTADRGGRRAALEAEQQRTLSAEEANTYLTAPVSAAERAEAVELVRWFRRRYPTGADRLAYVRRAYRRWRRDA